MATLTRKAQILIQTHCKSIAELNKKAKLQFEQGLSVSELNALVLQYSALEGRIRGILDMESMRLKNADCFIARFRSTDLLIGKLEVYLDSNEGRTLVHVTTIGDEHGENS